MYTYIYIYIYVLLALRPLGLGPVFFAGDRIRKGTNGVSTNGATACYIYIYLYIMFVVFLFLTEERFGYQSVKICQHLSSLTMLHTFFPQSVKKHYFCRDPISVDPICPQAMHVQSYVPCHHVLCVI